MVKREELHDYLTRLFNVALFPDFCENGCQVEGVEEIHSIAVAVSASLKVIEAAAAAQVQALLVHHGLFWNRDSYSVVGVKQAKLKLLLTHGISLFAYHLPLDAHREYGNNWKAAQDLGWKELEPFGAGENKKAEKIGVKGRFSPMPFALFREQLEQYYAHPSYVAAGGQERVQSAALVSGGAHKWLIEAAGEKVDCFVTGSFDEPIWHQAFEEKINFLALGHAATEEVGPKALGEHLQKKFNLSCRFIREENPF